MCTSCKVIVATEPELHYKTPELSSFGVCVTRDISGKTKSSRNRRPRREVLNIKIMTVELNAAIVSPHQPPFFLSLSLEKVSKSDKTRENTEKQEPITFHFNTRYCLLERRRVALCRIAATGFTLISRCEKKKNTWTLRLESIAET